MPREPRLAPDDIVRTHEEAAANERAPLLVLDPLEAFLDEHGLGAGEPVEVEPVGEGHSNVTYARATAAAPLRPAPPAAAAAAAQRPRRPARGARAARAGRPTRRAPEVLAVCDDEAVIGAPFYVMELVEGDVITAPMPGRARHARGAPAHRRGARRRARRAPRRRLAGAPGLEGFGKPTGYLERQVRRFLGLWEHNRTREIPAVERVGDWLREQPARVARGDDRPRRLPPGQRDVRRRRARRASSRSSTGRWRRSATRWPTSATSARCGSSADDPPLGMFELSARHARAEGFPTRAELVARYEERSGRSMTDIRWYTTLALWKSVVFMEGNYKRAVAGSTDDPFLKTFGEGVIELAAARRGDGAVAAERRACSSTGAAS